MPHGCSEQQLHRLLDDIYGAAIAPGRWSGALGTLAGIFGGGFADIFTRTHDRQHHRGMAYGLDRADYEDEFLGFWFKRNIWGNTKPVRVAGEVISTRDIVDIPQLLRSEIYENYLEPRDLHEGLRLSLFTDDNGIQDISILRPWSAGPFGAEDVAFGQQVLPHLQRAAAVTRRLREMEIAVEAGVSAIEASNLAVFLFDAVGMIVSLNAAASRIVAEGQLLTIVKGQLQDGSTGIGREIALAVGRAIGRAGGMRLGSVVRLRGSGLSSDANLMVLPVSGEEEWTFARRPAAMALLRDPATLSLGEERLASLFGLTGAEAELAQRLLSGLHLREIAAKSGRSLHTVRSHLARLMSKTGTKKQSDLIRLLLDVSTFKDPTLPS